jgi:hypothetical protein
LMIIENDALPVIKCLFLCRRLAQSFFLYQQVIYPHQQQVHLQNQLIFVVAAIFDLCASICPALNVVRIV